MNISTVPFPRIAQRIKAYADPFEHNPHQGFMAMSRSGKSYLIRHGVLPIYGNGRIVVLDVKPGGERTWAGYGNTVTELKPGFGNGPDGSAHYHFMVESKDQVSELIEIIGYEGHCVLVIDDSRRITANAPDYGQGSAVDNLLTIGAAIGITIIICANSTVWATSGLRDQVGIKWLGQMANENERVRFIRQAGLEKSLLPILGNLPPRHFLYSDRYDGPVRLAITNYE